MVAHRAEALANAERLAREVVRDMPGAALVNQLTEAMKRNKGSMHPVAVEAMLYLLRDPKGDA